MRFDKKQLQKYNYRITFYFKTIGDRKMKPRVCSGIFSFDNCITPETKVDENVKTYLTTKHENAERLNELLNSEGSRLEVVVTDIAFLGQS